MNIHVRTGNKNKIQQGNYNLGCWSGNSSSGHLNFSYSLGTRRRELSVLIIFNSGYNIRLCHIQAWFKHGLPTSFLLDLVPVGSWDRVKVFNPTSLIEREKRGVK